MASRLVLEDANCVQLDSMCKDMLSGLAVDQVLEGGNWDNVTLKMQ